MALSIPTNTFQQEAEANDKIVREEIVQYICDAFLDYDGNCREYHPFSHNNRGCRPHEDCVASKHSKWRPHFMSSGSNCYEDGKGIYQFTNAEMDTAVRELLNHGFYLFRFYMYDSWETYRFSKRADLGAGYERVSSIPHFLV